MLLYKIEIKNHNSTLIISNHLDEVKFALCYIIMTYNNVQFGSSAELINNKKSK